jgi:hypothetical protein
MNRLKFLVLTNESFVDSAPGQKDAINLLCKMGWIESVEFVSHSCLGTEDLNFDRVITALREAEYDAVFLWSPREFPRSRDKFEEIIEVIANRPIFYWEGDPWVSRGIKSWTEPMKWWANQSEVIFSVAKEPHVKIIKSCSNAEIFFVPHTYCHIQFAMEEKNSPRKLTSSKSVSMIANQSARIPFIYGTPGSGVRFLAAVSLKYRLKEDFQLFGRGWPQAITTGTISYRDQAKKMREFSISANWDNFTEHESYASDRLPISMIAGRVHVTSAHPGLDFYGDETVGVYKVGSIFELHNRISQLRSEDPVDLNAQGQAGFDWVRDRLSHRQAARFMFSKITSNVPPLNFFPWSVL